MKLEKNLAAKIFKDLLLSAVIYALPIILMFGWFYITKQKPWLTSNTNQTVKIKTK